MLYSRKTNVIFGILQVILYLAFLVLDLTEMAPDYSVAIKYTIIILCFCYAFFTKDASKSIFFCSAKVKRLGHSSYFKSNAVLMYKIALFFTVVSDLFLLVLDVQLLGVLTFIVVQVFYGLRISLVKEHNIVKEFMTRIIIQALLTLLLVVILMQMKVLINPLLVVTIFYFIYILTNTLLTIIRVITNTKYKTLSMKLFTSGMVLFLLCDINVGLFNMASFVSMPKNIYTLLYSLSSILMWTFYAPSQVLLAYSTQVTAKENTNKSV